MPRKDYTTEPHQTIPDPSAAQLYRLRHRRGHRSHAYTAAAVATYRAGYGVPAIAAASYDNPTALARRIFRGIAAGRTTPPAGYHVPPRPALAADRHPSMDPLPDMPAYLAERLWLLSGHANGRRGCMSADHPARRAAESFDALLLQLLADGWRPAQLARACRKPLGTMAARIRRARAYAAS